MSGGINSAQNDILSRKKRDQDSTDGFAHVYDGVGRGQSFNRELDAAQILALTTTTAVKFTWPQGSRPTLLDIKPIGGAVWVAFDAPDDPTGLNWVNGAAGENIDSQRFLIPEYLPEETTVAGPSNKRDEIPFTDGLSNMYILEFATGVTSLSVEAS